MARRRGGFASNGFASGSGGTTSQPPATSPAGRNRAGRHRNGFNAGRDRRQDRRADRRDKRGQEDGASPIDEFGQDLAFEDQDPETLRYGAWGVLNNAGISNNPLDNPFGRNADPFIEGVVGSWVDEHLGNVLAGDPNATWADKLGDIGGDVMNAASGGGAATPQDFRTWAQQTQGMNAHQINQLNATQRQRLRRRYEDNYLAGFDAGGGANTTVDTAGLREALTAGWAAQTPHQRQYNSAEWVAPKRTIQF
jgi:hypothetical protein